MTVSIAEPVHKGSFRDDPGTWGNEGCVQGTCGNTLSDPLFLVVGSAMLQGYNKFEFITGI
jgi:hypothetical protein